MLIISHFPPAWQGGIEKRIKNRHITRDLSRMMCLLHFITISLGLRRKFAYFEASSIATATATVIPTMGLLPAPIRPIIST